MAYFKYNVLLLTVFACLSPTISSSTGMSGGIDTEHVNDIFGVTANVFEYVSNAWDVVNDVGERFAEAKERKILTEIRRITNMVKATQTETDDIKIAILGYLRNLKFSTDALFNGIQVGELLECVKSIQDDFSIMEGRYTT